MANQRILKIFLGLITCCAVTLLMLYMAGILTGDKVGPGEQIAIPQQSPPPSRTEEAKTEYLRDFYEAVGTIRPRTETTVEAQITARIEEVLVRPGQMVSRGTLLVTLDGREARSRLERAKEGLVAASARREQAVQALAAARAALNKAEASYRRTKSYLQAGAATAQDMEGAESAFLQAQAGVRQAEDAVKEADAGIRKAEKLLEEAQIAVGYTRILAHEEGQIAKRLAEPGDLAVPGRPLLVIQTRASLRLEALVREGHVQRVMPGAAVKGSIESINLVFDTTIEELVPSGDSATRTFLVKAPVPQDRRIFPGMFGRLLIPLDEKRVVTVPLKAVKRVGQLETLLVMDGKTWRRVLVKTGRILDGRVEILTGLTGGELIAIEEVGGDA
jgi:RND family efflux transporter MFP subunit